MERTHEDIDEGTAYREQRTDLRGSLRASRSSLSPDSCPLIPAHSQSRWWLWVIFGLLLTSGILFSATPAYADPHAVFYTDRAQAQLFYNVLAALNQADYVENPDTPKLSSDQRLGLFIRTGEYDPTLAPRRRIERLPKGGIRVNPAPEPLEQQGVELPRIRVRQVTSDDGDVFYRERLERRALSEEMRVLLARLTCRSAETIYGPTQAKSRTLCPATPDPDIVPLPPP